MNIINGPVNNLRKVTRSKSTRSDLQEAIKHFLDSFDLDLDADGDPVRKPKWHSDDDAAILLLFGRMHDGVLADELGCSIQALRTRAFQKGKLALSEEFDEDSIQMVRNLHNKGASNEEIASIMQIDVPMAPYSHTIEENNEVQQKVAKYTKQTDAFKG